MAFRRKVDALGIEELISAPRSPWQSCVVEKLIESIRRECKDHLILRIERHLLRTLREYMESDNEVRPHQSLGGNAPVARLAESPDDVLAAPVFGGLHHRYTRAA